jgi:hypothetical protein
VKEALLKSFITLVLARVAHIEVRKAEMLRWWPKTNVQCLTCNGRLAGSKRAKVVNASTG